MGPAYFRQIVALPTLVAVLAPACAWACRYSVRDIGFIDRGDSALRVVVEGEGLAGVAQQLRERIDAIGVDAVVYAETGPSPRVVLAHAERSRELASGPPDRLVEAAFAAIEPSDEVARVTGELVERCCGVLLIESASADATERAAVQLAAAAERAVAEADVWEKPMGGEPLIIRWTADDARREALTLWALGFDPDSDKPQAAVLYGRWRRLGPVFSGDGIEAEAVARVIGVLGRDCECDLSRDVFAGPTAPHPWDERLAERTRERLEFDPEHPMNVMEARQILASKPTEKPAGDAFAANNAFLGYEEIDLTAALDGLAGESTADPVAEDTPPAGATPSAPEPDASAREVADPGGTPYGAVAAAVVALAVVSGLAGWWMTRAAS